MKLKPQTRRSSKRRLLVVVALLFAVVFMPLIHADAPFADNFPGSSLDSSKWNAFGVGVNGSITVGNGFAEIASMNATQAGILSVPTFATSTVSFQGNFTGTVEFGLAVSGENHSYAELFASDASEALYVDTAANNTHSVHQVLPSNPAFFASIHQFRISWSFNFVAYYVDGLLVRNETLVPKMNLHIVAYGQLGTLWLNLVSVGSLLLFATSTTTVLSSATLVSSTTTTDTNTSFEVTTTTSTSTSASSTVQTGVLTVLTSTTPSTTTTTAGTSVSTSLTTTVTTGPATSTSTPIVTNAGTTFFAHTESVNITTTSSVQVTELDGTTTVPYTQTSPEPVAPVGPFDVPDYVWSFFVGLLIGLALLFLFRFGPLGPHKTAGSLGRGQERERQERVERRRETSRRPRPEKQDEASDQEAYDSRRESSRSRLGAARNLLEKLKRPRRPSFLQRKMAEKKLEAKHDTTEPAEPPGGSTNEAEGNETQ